MIEARDHLPAAEQLLVCSGKVLADGSTLAASSVGCDSTVHVLLRLCGGKGGFGALLRGQGRDGKITTNDDACRDLSGRRLRHKNAEQKLQQWTATAKEREQERLELQQLKEKAKQEKRDMLEQALNITEIVEQQRTAAERVTEAVASAIAQTKTAEAAKGKRQAVSAAAAPAKKPKCLALLEELSDSDSDASDEE